MATQESTVVIYALKDPFTDRIRYIGKADSVAGRLRGHLKEARRCDRKHEHHKCAWLGTLLNRGSLPRVVELEVVNRADWQSAERAWIIYGRWSGWPLTNATDSGDGADRAVGQRSAVKLRAWLKANPERAAEIEQKRREAVIAANKRRSAAGGYVGTGCGQAGGSSA